MLRRSRFLIVFQASAIAMALLLSACDGVPVGQQVSNASVTQGATVAASNSPTAQASVSPSPSTSATNPARPAPISTGILPPGSALPSEATCAARVHRSPWEPRPANKTANMSVPTAAQIAAMQPWGAAMGMSPKADTLRRQITGNFTGTTDEIIQWAACKWGFDPNILRADAVVESYWKQSQQGDYTSDKQSCPPGSWDGAGCFQSYGLFQIKWYYFKDAFPMAQKNTAFNAEYVFGILRACFEGWTTYLNDGTPLPGYSKYHAGDIWGCLGRWYSGWWYTRGAVVYFAKVKSALAAKTWKSANF